MSLIFVIPAEAGIPLLLLVAETQRDPRVRGGDGLKEPS
jgi:hypothetical protein